MKRRHFLVTSTTGLAGLAAARLGRAATPCPPPAFNAGGSTIASSCVPVVPGSAPAWFLNATAGAWTAVAGAANQTVKSVVPNPAPSNPGSDPLQIVAAWTGAGVDQPRGEYLLCANGGHSDYGGNECYALALRAATPAWRRLSDPTPQSHLLWNDTEGPLGAVNADGRPRAMHNTFECYGDGRVWFPEQNSFSSPSGNTTHAMISYNRDALGAGTTPLPWTTADLGPWTLHAKPDFRGQGVTPTAFGRAAFDKVGHKVWAVGGNNNINNPYYWYVNTTGANLGQSIVYHKDNSLDNFNNWCIIASDLRIMVCGGQNNGKIYVLSIDRAGASDDWQTVSNVSGTGFYDMGGGGAYIPANHTIAIGNPKTTGSTVYRLQIPTKIVSGLVQYDSAGTWVWTTLNPGGAAVVVPTIGNRDTYSKWNVIEDMGNGQSAIIVITAYDGPVYVYKVPITGL